jgi:ferritin-like metal-binding protein YciE
MSLSNLEDVFEHELTDVLDAERQILKALPKMIKAAESEELKTALEEHRGVTEEQVGRLETIFKSLGKAARGKHCKGMEGLLAEGADMIEEEETGAPLDAAMICGAQKVEHYEIAAYGSLIAYAKLLNMPEAVKLLEATLDEEKEADKTLSGIASELNLMAQEQAANE